MPANLKKPKPCMSAFFRARPRTRKLPKASNASASAWPPKAHSSENHEPGCPRSPMLGPGKNDTTNHLSSWDHEVKTGCPRSPMLGPGKHDSTDHLPS